RSLRSGRTVRAPRHFTDFVIHEETSLAHLPPGDLPPEPEPLRADATPEPLVDPTLTTKPNRFGVFRVYPDRPTINPDAGSSIDRICDAPTLATTPGPTAGGAPAPRPQPSPSTPHEPFSSRTAAIAINWRLTGPADKSSAPELDRLFRDLGHLGGSIEEMKGFRTASELAALDRYLKDVDNPFHQEDGWKSTSVRIRLPSKKHKFNSEKDAPELEVPGLVYRRIFDIVKHVFESDVAQTFHHVPFEERYIPDDDDPATSERVYSEIYSSPAMLEAHQEIKALPRAPDDTLERVVVPLLIWSDSTHLANFGTASVWPIYMFFGSQSKYTRAKPSSHACHHLAYIPTLPKDFQDQYMKIYGDAAADNIFTHCKRELMHGVWDHLLDDDFMDAYRHGMVLLCDDGIHRRFFPRLFTYSADYPEKVLLACIRNLGRCPCPRCYVEKVDIPKVTSADDMATRRVVREDNADIRRRVEKSRKLMFEKAKGISSKPVERLLSQQSLVPTRNAFRKLSIPSVKFDYYKMLVPDVLHESELGTVKSTAAQLFRLVHELPGDMIAELNRRFRQIPTFGRGTIRRFDDNVSEMKKFAGRDYEDFIQCAIAAFDGLFEDLDQNAAVLDLLFCLATEHAYIKLRQHTDSTIRWSRQSDTALGQAFCQFITAVCDVIPTKELPKETAARGRRHAAAARKRAAEGGAGKQATTVLTANHKEFNMATFKIHSFPDYPDTVEHFGTTDNYNTQTGELEHKIVKARYGLTNKNHFVQQLADQEARERFAERHLHQRLVDSRPGAPAPSQPPDDVLPPPDGGPPPPGMSSAARKAAEDDDDLPPTDPNAHYHVAEATRDFLEIGAWLADNKAHPALKDFRTRLVDHILSRVLNDPNRHDFTDAERNTIFIARNRMHLHKVLRINYTTYDCRREQDSINPRTHPHIVLLSPDDPDDPAFHPFLYAQVHLIFHVEFRHIPAQSQATDVQRLDIAWVEWLMLDKSIPCGFEARRLPVVGPLKPESPNAFGFVDPNDVLRAVHIMPGFMYGTRHPSVTQALFRQQPDTDEHEDDSAWNRYLVGIFSDRDHFMLQRGGGIGHLATRYCSAALRKNEPAHETALSDVEDTETDEADDDALAAELDDRDDLWEDEWGGPDEWEGDAAGEWDGDEAEDMERGLDEEAWDDEELAAEAGF
ncbi:hypothetical protein FA95DRAFT_1478129, partial [Auriscalpium vulgare]